MCVLFLSIEIARRKALRRYKSFLNLSENKMDARSASLQIILNLFKNKPIG